MRAYPIVTITTEKIGKADQSVLGISNGPSAPKKGSVTSVDVYRAIVTDTEDPNFRLEFGVTRDAFALTQANYISSAKANGNGDGPRLATNIAFEPANGKNNEYRGYVKVGGFPKNSPTLYLANKGEDAGDIQLQSTYRPAAKELKFSSSATSASGVMLHIGGWYKTTQDFRLSASEACFGIVNPNNSKANPSNAETKSVIERIVSQADNSQTDKGRIDIIVEKRKEIPKSRLFAHEKIN